MKVIIACEFSQIVTGEFIKKGHDVISCDYLPGEKGLPHYQGDVMDILDNGWDMMIAFPPCQYLTTAANRHFKNNPERWKRRLKAMLFVHKLMNANIDKIAIENPKGVISSWIRKPDQIVQPYYFGNSTPKPICLWLRNLPLLKYNNGNTLFGKNTSVEPEYIFYNSKRTKSGKSKYSRFGKLGSGYGKERSIFFPEVAKAMAEQWG